MKHAIATFVTDESISPGALASAVEERGFHSLVVPEHSHMPAAYEEPFPGAGKPGREYYRTLDPFVVLTAAAAATKDLVLVTGVLLLAQRDVFYTAKEVASLDLLSGGRVRMGVGVGWNRHEMRNCGVDPATRGAKIDEQIRALRHIWSNEVAEFHGDFVDFGPIFSWPKPVQQPTLPIYIGGSSDAALQRVCDVGDGWLPPPLPPAGVLRARQFMTDNGRSDIGITIFGAPTDPRALADYAAAGVDEVAFLLPTLPESEALRELDKLAALERITT